MGQSDIILIGPIGVGKSTVGSLLSQSLEIDLVDLDDLWRDYADEIGYDTAFVDFLRSKGGFWAMWMYNKEFYCNVVQQILADHEKCVFAFGAGHSVYETPTHHARVKRAFEPYRHVVLLLPSPNADRARERVLAVRPDMPDDLKAHILEHPSNERLAKFTVYTEGATPEETRDEILALIDQER